MASVARETCRGCASRPVPSARALAIARRILTKVPHAVRRFTRNSCIRICCVRPGVTQSQSAVFHGKLHWVHAACLRGAHQFPCGRVPTAFHGKHSYRVLQIPDARHDPVVHCLQAVRTARSVAARPLSADSVGGPSARDGVARETWHRTFGVMRSVSRQTNGRRFA